MSVHQFHLSPSARAAVLAHAGEIRQSLKVRREQRDHDHGTLNCGPFEAVEVLKGCGLPIQAVIDNGDGTTDFYMRGAA